MAQSIIHGPWKELKFLGFVQWIKYYYFILSGCFPSCIFSLLWLSLFFDKGRQRTCWRSFLGRPHRVLFGYSGLMLAIFKGLTKGDEPPLGSTWGWGLRMVYLTRMSQSGVAAESRPGLSMKLKYFFTPAAQLGLVHNFSSLIYYVLLVLFYKQGH